MPIDINDLLATEGDDSMDHVLCPDCNGAGYSESPYGPCPRCGRAGYVPIDSLSERERVAWADLLEEQQRNEGPLSGNIPEEEMIEGSLDEEDEDRFPWLDEEDIKR